MIYCYYYVCCYYCSVSLLSEVVKDDQILEYQNEDGHSIEPRWYCPVIPMVLVNGVEGIGQKHSV